MSLPRVLGLAPLFLFFIASLAASQANPPKSDWELEQEKRDFKEAEITLPATPMGELIEFFVSAASNFRFFIDPRSLSVGADDVVRYTLVARSPSGAETVSYEGMRCNGGTYKVYAFVNGGVWSRSRGNPDWRPIEPKSVQRWHPALRREYFCPFDVRISTAAEGLDYLRRGGHPDFKRSF
ncbi:MAG: CNP1-like family protein [Pseudomonadota bacterium]